MIKEYFRPKTVKDAVEILNSRSETIILSGGTHINSFIDKEINVVDIQELEFKTIEKKGNQVIIGSLITLQELINNELIPFAMKQAIAIDAPVNLRNMSTIGGSIVVAGGQSSLSTVLLALDATVQFTPDVGEFPFTEFITSSTLREGRSIITAIKFPESKIEFESIASTPFSQPIVSAALSTRFGGKTRLALGGYGKNPLLVFDGLIDDEISSAARSAYLDAGDEQATSEYRSEMAAVLTKRCVTKMKSSLGNVSQGDE